MSRRVVIGNNIVHNICSHFYHTRPRGKVSFCTDIHHTNNTHLLCCLSEKFSFVSRLCCRLKLLRALPNPNILHAATTPRFDKRFRAWNGVLSGWQAGCLGDRANQGAESKNVYLRSFAMCARCSHVCRISAQESCIECRI